MLSTNCVWLPVGFQLAAKWLAIGSQMTPKWLPDSKRNTYLCYVSNLGSQLGAIGLLAGT